MYRRKAKNSARVRNMRNLEPMDTIVRLKKADQEEKDRCRCGGTLIKKGAAYECGACHCTVFR